MEKSPERPIATLSEVFAIAAGIQSRYRLLVLRAAFAQLRYGELMALRRSDITMPSMRKPTAKVWKAALKRATANPALHLHNLRHTGGTLTAQTGATLKEIMSRIGHSSTRAAMLYQRASDIRSRGSLSHLSLDVD